MSPPGWCFSSSLLYAFLRPFSSLFFLISFPSFFFLHFTDVFLSLFYPWMDSLFSSWKLYRCWLYETAFSHGVSTTDSAPVSMLCPVNTSASLILKSPSIASPNQSSETTFPNSSLNPHKSPSTSLSISLHYEWLTPHFEERWETPILNGKIKDEGYQWNFPHYTREKSRQTVSSYKHTRNKNDREASGSTFLP